MWVLFNSKFSIPLFIYGCICTYLADYFSFLFASLCCIAGVVVMLMREDYHKETGSPRAIPTFQFLFLVALSVMWMFRLLAYFAGIDEVALFSKLFIDAPAMLTIMLGAGRLAVGILDNFLLWFWSSLDYNQYAHVQNVHSNQVGEYCDEFGKRYDQITHPDGQVVNQYYTNSGQPYLKFFSQEGAPYAYFIGDHGDYYTQWIDQNGNPYGSIYDSNGHPIN